MKDSAERFAEQLEEVALNIVVEQRYVLAAMMRRAAILLRNANGVYLAPDVEKKLAEVAASKSTERGELATRIIRDWRAANKCLPVRDLNDSE